MRYVRNWRILFSLLFLALLVLPGCDLALTRLIYKGLIQPTPRGAEVSSGLLFKNTYAVFGPGNLKISGSLVPSGAQAAGAFPSQIRFIITHQDSKGKTVASFPFDVVLSSTGQIPAQNLPVAGIQLNAKESVFLSIVPLDSDLPLSDIKLKIKYKASA